MDNKKQSTTGGNGVDSLVNVVHDAERALTDIQNYHTSLETRMRLLETTADGMFQQIGDIHHQMEQTKREDANKIRSLQIRLQELQEEGRRKDELLRLKQLRNEGTERARYEGVLIWQIHDVQQKLKDAKAEKATSLDSPSFHTSRTGYKMCARIYLNGDGMGKGTHVSLFFVVMRGHYDGLLRWPFRQKVTFMLLDQNNNREHVIDAFRPDPTSSSFQRPTSDMNIASGCPLFVPLSQLDSSHGYIMDDIIFVKVVVEEL
ncbi:TRAF2 [Branchiostoma lanceolatum]|uniref:TRAF2 protein n=1 Tax=Branchiostoma lanceolatum TaxID=7740 RepID=A0A8K0A9S6_BRALA|nr:TRAF2 [Branchiostoma lanceolatum]